MLSVLCCWFGCLLGLLFLFGIVVYCEPFSPPSSTFLRLTRIDITFNFLWIFLTLTHQWTTQCLWDLKFSLLEALKPRLITILFSFLFNCIIRPVFAILLIHRIASLQIINLSFSVKYGV